jgi:TRAP-type C4-dicarboxylate transport system substrate-binding protein
MVEKESKGQFTFKNYPNAVLNTTGQGFRATMTDIADIAHGYPFTQAASFNLSHVNDLPLALLNQQGGALVMETLYPKYLKAEYEKMGVYLAFWVTTSPYNIISKKPIRSLADLKGMKIRSGGGYASDVLEALGAVPVTVAGPELYTAFQSGIVDGLLHMDAAVASYKLQEIGKYILQININRLGVPYCLNKKFFDALAPEKKRFFYNKLRQASQMASVAYDIDDIYAKKFLKEQNVEFTYFSEDEMQKVHKAMESVWKKFMDANEAKGLPAKQFVEDIRALSAKYKDLTPQQAMEMVTKEPVQGIINF